MDDKQLNRKIAREMGWKPTCEDHLQLEWIEPKGTVQPLPYFLDKHYLPELLDLGKKMLGLFDLGWRDPGWICQTGTPTCEAVDVWAGPTPSLPLARAIVAFKEASHEASEEDTSTNVGQKRRGSI